MPTRVLLAVVLLLSFVAATSLAADQPQQPGSPGAVLTQSPPDNAPNPPGPRSYLRPPNQPPQIFGWPLTQLAPRSCFAMHIFSFRRVRPQSDETRLRGESWCLESSKVKFKNLAPAGAGAGK